MEVAVDLNIIVILGCIPCLFFFIHVTNLLNAYLYQTPC